MLPELEGDPGTSRRFVTPDTFNIEYQWVGGGGKENSYLNKIATCVLKNMSATPKLLTALKFSITNWTELQLSIL